MAIAHFRIIQNVIRERKLNEFLGGSAIIEHVDTDFWSSAIANGVDEMCKFRVACITNRQGQPMDGEYVP